jgi:hypothetical protein
MVHNIQIYWVFGLYPSSGILETRNSVSETGSVCLVSSHPSEDGSKSSVRNVRNKVQKPSNPD